MIDVTRVVAEFRAADLAAYINEYSPADLVYRNHFPTQFTPSLTFEALQAQFSARVAADVVAFDSRAPRKGRQMPGKITGDIPKVEIARVKKESDLNIYRQLVAARQGTAGSAGSAQIRNRIIEWMYDDARFVLDGVNARMEWLAKQAASTGKYSLTLANNEGGVQTKVDVSFGIPAGNITNAATDWDTAETATPIADIKAKVAAARAKGVRLLYAFTDQATFDRMVMTAEVQKFSASFGANALGIQQTPNLEAVNASLRSAGLPTFVIWDSYVNLETKAGTYLSTTGWADGAITLAPSQRLGDTQWTTTADAYVQIDESVKVQNDLALVKTFAEQDPITVVTKGIAYATPVLNDAANLYILKTQL